MNIIEQATKRLEQLERAGVAVPWAAAGMEGRADATAKAEFSNADADADADSDLAVLDESAPPEAPAVALPSRPQRVGPAASPSSHLQEHREVATCPQQKPRSSVEIDIEQLRRTGNLVPDQVRSEMAEQFRHVKRPLLKNARSKSETLAKRGALIMVTSAVPGEGKTFCSINLAMSMAMEVDTSVLLIDADVVRPSLFKRLGIEAKAPGLLDLLTRDDIELADALVATNVPKLTLMASGERSGRSTELLASTSMDALLARLATDYSDHIIIFDAPPLLLTTESSELASKVGQVVVVVESAKTSRSSVQQAFEALRNCPIVMSILNKGDEPSGGRRYGYYYQ